MLVYIPSRHNDSLFDDYCGQNCLPITKHNVRKLHNFVESGISNLSHVTVLAVDLSALEDSDSEIITALQGFRSMYPAARVVVVALNRESGDPLLMQLESAGIDDIISEDMPGTLEQAITRCLSPDRKPQHIDPPVIPPPEPVSHEEQKKDTPLPKRERVSVPLFRDEPPPPAYHAPRKYVVAGRAVNIGICGTHRKIGVTHHALMLCAYLNSTGYKAAYLESNAHKSIVNIDKRYSVNSNTKVGLRQYRGIDLFSAYSLPVVLALKYGFYIHDYGTYQEVSAKEFLTNDIKIVVGGSKAWELPFYLPLFEQMDGYTDLHFILNFTPEDERETITQLMGIYGDTTHFSGYAPDPFSTGANDEMFDDILQALLESGVNGF